jgi:hypothetical protein
MDKKSELFFNTKDKLKLEGGSRKDPHLKDGVEYLERHSGKTSKEIEKMSFKNFKKLVRKVLDPKAGLRKSVIGAALAPTVAGSAELKDIKKKKFGGIAIQGVKDPNQIHRS